jgi:hypothetical protein
MEWDKFLKRYVWDDDTTPYLIPVARLSRRQARSEIRAYVILVATLFSVLALVTLSVKLPGGRSPGMSLLCFTMVCAAFLLLTTRHPWSAAYTALGPVALAGYFYANAASMKLGGVDYLVILIVVAFWLRYCLRLYRVTEHYPDMPEGEDAPGTRRHWGRKR